MPKPSTIGSFRARQEAEGAFDAVDRGLAAVPLDRVVGSVSRYLDFDRRFRLRKRRPRERLQAVRRAMQQGRPIEPLQLCKIKDDYYVADGHHRVAVAKELGFRDLEAWVVEFLPSAGSRENILYRERRAFESETGLQEGIQLSEQGKYAHLMMQIIRHREHLSREAGESGAPVSLAQAAEDWFTTIYRPLVALIDGSGLPKSFPLRSAGDLYAYISHQQWDLGHERRYPRALDRVISRTMEEFRQAMQGRPQSDYPEMLREITAFVLANIAATKEAGIVDRLFRLEEVREVHSVHGSIDLIIKVVLRRDLLSSDAEVISQYVQDKIRRVPGILSTQTLIPGLSRVKPSP
jgi:hypothetical protein